MMKRILLGVLSILIILAGGWWFFRPSVPILIERARHIVQPESVIRFAVVGDNHGDNPIYRQILKDIAHQPYTFLLNLADTSEHGLSEEFLNIRELEATLPYPVYHTVGSHDIKTDTTRQSFVKAFGHQPWYSIDQGRMHLIILDNADRKVGFPLAELEWLEQDLRAHNTTVNLIAYHRPFDLPLANLLGDDETKASTISNERLKTILAGQNVQYIFTSHLHTYLPYSVAGIPAVVTGGGGDPAQIVLGGAKNNYFHYLEVTIKGNTVDVNPIRVTLRSPSAE